MYSKISLFCKSLLVFISLSFFLSSCSSGLEYSIKTDLNPNKISPLTAMLQIKTDKPCSVRVKVLGDIPVEQYLDSLSTDLEVSVLGLYPDKLNRVEVTLDYEGGQKIDVIEIQTEEIPAFFPSIRVNKLEKDKMEPGMHAMDIHFANFGKFRSAPIIFDDLGNIRWYLDLSFHGAMVGPFQKIRNGNILVAGRRTIYEFDMMGKQIDKTLIDNNYGIHHDVLELPNGDLLLCVGTRDAYIEKDNKTILSDSDFMIHFDRKKSKVIQKWDLADHLDVSRDDLNFFRGGDWLHMNALEFDSRDSTIIVSGRNQGLLKVSWDDKLKWIMSPKQNWGASGRKGKGYETKPYLLTAVSSEGVPYSKDIQTGHKSADDFDFPWGPHAPSLLPNGNIIVFDNGPFRNYNNENNYSRAVEYEIDETNKTFKQVWQYGKERGVKLFSSIVSDVDFLPQTKNILMTSGFVSPKNIHRGKIVEVSPEDNSEVFEATVFFKSTNKGSKPGWGQTDILYRSERMELKN